MYYETELEDLSISYDDITQDTKLHEENFIVLEDVKNLFYDRLITIDSELCDLIKEVEKDIRNGYHVSLNKFLEDVKCVVDNNIYD